MLPDRSDEVTRGANPGSNLRKPVEGLLGLAAGVCRQASRKRAVGVDHLRVARHHLGECCQQFHGFVVGTNFGCSFQYIKCER